MREIETETMREIETETGQMAYIGFDNFNEAKAFAEELGGIVTEFTYSVLRDEWKFMPRRRSIEKPFNVKDLVKRGFINQCDDEWLMAYSSQPIAMGFYPVAHVIGVVKLR